MEEGVPSSCLMGTCNEPSLIGMTGTGKDPLLARLSGKCIDNLGYLVCGGSFGILSLPEGQVLRLGGRGGLRSRLP